MPKFEKSTGYKMKGSAFYGKSISSGSPLKVSDKDIVAAQAQLDKVETKFRQPGWAKAAHQIYTKSKNPMSKDTDLEEGEEQGGNGNGGGSEEKTQNVSERVANTGDLDPQKSANLDYDPSKEGKDVSFGGQSYSVSGSPAGYRVRVDNKRR